MGIRPTFHLVYGIDDLQFDEKNWKIIDSRYDGREIDWDAEVPRIESKEPKSFDRDLDVWLSNVYLEDRDDDPVFRTEKRTKKLHEVLLHRPEYGLSSVIGFEIESEYNLELWWAFSGFDERYSENGYHVVPKATYRHHHLQAIQELFRQCDEKNLSKFSLRPFLKNFSWELYGRRKHIIYPHFMDTTVDAWRKTALHLFNHIGLSGIRDKDLKLMIYWTWG